MIRELGCSSNPSSSVVYLKLRLSFQVTLLAIPKGQSTNYKSNFLHQLTQDALR
ncbi:hypothetical protein RI543_003199 [Arxiozyma heterogenica]|uniref:Uncharacterized protein n=1 Tax=Arxiozyma heterogenica TaxID=278026 RepID=A0AAN7ZS81_9SACH|nr:hypothetical protein RI543_003199 [Kazachstania heterogenica]